MRKLTYAVIYVAIAELTSPVRSQEGNKPYLYNNGVKIEGRFGDAAARRGRASLDRESAPEAVEYFLSARPISDRMGGDLIYFADDFFDDDIHFILWDPGANRAAAIGSIESYLETEEADDVQIAHPFFTEKSDKPLLITKQIVFWPRLEVSDQGLRQALADCNLGPDVARLDESDPLPHSVELLHYQDPGEILRAAACLYERREGVFEWVHPNLLLDFEPAQQAATCPDSESVSRWHLELLGVDPAPEMETGDPGIEIAVIDNSFKIAPSSADDRYPVFHNRLAGSRSFADPSAPDDLEGSGDGLHGNGAFALAVAGGDRTDLRGACPDCRGLAVVKGWGLLSVAKSLQWAAEEGARVISGSWGADAQVDGEILEGIEKTLKKLREEDGVLMFFAAGNDGERIIYPASSEFTVAVGASSRSDERWTYSAWKRGLEPGRIRLLAPSGCHPPCDCRAPCEDRCTCGLQTLSWNGAVNACYGGTSGATPLAAGVAGLLFSCQPELTADEAQEILERTATKIPCDADYDETSGLSERCGAGRVNAADALATLVKELGACVG